MKKEPIWITDQDDFEDVRITKEKLKKFEEKVKGIRKIRVGEE